MAVDPQPHHLRLYRAEIDLWKEKVTSDPILLSREELLRYNRYQVQEKKDQFLVTTSLTRIILSSILGISPQKIPISYTSSGKPLLRDHEVNFNLSHSGNQYLLLVAEKATCGVDIQQVYTIHPDDRFIQNAFHKREIAYLNTHEGKNDYLNCLFSLWTAKEAYLKAVGSGIDGYPQWLGMLPDPLSPEEFNFIAGVEKSESEIWTVRSLKAPDGYEAAFAYHGHITSMKEYSYEPGDLSPVEIKSSLEITRI